MDLFKNRIQPTIVHLGSYNGIKDKYFLNYNVVQIDWFANNSIVLEDGSGVLTLESADDTNPFSALSHGIMDLMEDGVYDGNSVLDIPRIYFPITNKFISNTGEAVTPNVINSFITTILHLSDNCVEHALPDSTSFIADFIINGESFDGITLVPGVDYYINETFANYLIKIDLNVEYPDLVPEGIELYDKIQRIKSITLPNYLDKESNICEPWIPLTATEENNTDLTLYYNINYLGELVNTYDLANFYSSFCQVILDKSNIEIQLSDFQNLKYKKVLEYFANGKTDEASQMIQLILGSQFNTAQTIKTASQLCKCNSNNSSTGISSCSTLYNDAMTELLKEMLGNVEFYRDWFYDVQEDKSMKVNDELVKYIKLLIKGFVDAGYDLSFSNNYRLNCGCQTSTNLASTANYNIINKYDEVLNYVLSCSLQYNINKTKLYGSQFGELLPKLQF
jgi:hypothetical protein